jgi:hypothetical protein
VDKKEEDRECQGSDSGKNSLRDQKRMMPILVNPRKEEKSHGMGMRDVPKPQAHHQGEDYQGEEHVHILHEACQQC